MADVLRLSFNSLSSVLTSFSSSLNSLQPGVPPNQKSYKRILSASDSSTSGIVARFAFRPTKQFDSFKIHIEELAERQRLEVIRSKVSSSSHPKWPLEVYPVINFRTLRLVKVHATVAETDPPKWWERNAGPNMIDIHSTQDFLSALSQAGERLVIVEFYGTWCASCRALFPKLCRTAQEHPEILFLKVNFDENKPMCKSLNVKVLPYFHFYRGADGQLDSFSCSLAKFQKIKDAIQAHNTARCSIGPPKGVGDLNLEALSAPNEAGSSTT